MASEVGGFRTIRVKFSETCSSYHFLYFKKHAVRDEDTTKPPDKTLFVVNIPPYCTKVRPNFSVDCCMYCQTTFRSYSTVSVLSKCLKITLGFVEAPIQLLWGNKGCFPCQAARVGRKGNGKFGHRFWQNQGKQNGGTYKLTCKQGFIFYSTLIFWAKLQTTRSLFVSLTLFTFYHLPVNNQLRFKLLTCKPWPSAPLVLYFY